MKNVAAVVVSFHPEMPILDSLLASLLDQVELLVLVDNGGGADYLAADASLRERVCYLPLGENKGLGFALNAGFAEAVQKGMRFMVTFDQDSHAQPDLIERLQQAMDNAKRLDDKAIAVSPAFFDRRDGKEINFPFYTSVGGSIKPVFESDNAHGLVKADALITSGMFVDVQAWVQGIKYDEGMFVDFTDTEWCFRVRDRGYSLYGCLQVQMGHALSDAPPVKFLGLSFFRYSPVRRYFFFRNTVAVCRMPHTPALWKRRMITALMLRFVVNLMIDTDRKKSLGMMIRGIRHGAKASLGPVH
jgi:rhamnosyltransferase